MENIIEVLLSLRVNALQISPELRRNLVSELIKNDMFLITQNKNNNFVMDLLNINSHGLKHAICALISVIASTIKGVDYLTQIDLAITEKVVEILKDQEDGSVTQRFCIAILQKMSVKETTIELFVQKGLIQWVLKLLDKSKQVDIHIFSLDFASALLANILHSHSTLEYLEKQSA